jgi:alpha-beta hydrolase superfamily lysophospholipase
MTDALYFDSGARRLFGWYHSPAGDRTANFGIVVCKPFGYEAICAHRGIRAFSHATSNLGVPTLRFDYAGTGDSSEIDPEADQLEMWSQDTMAAVQEVQRLGGVQRVYLLGFRLGSMIAALASARCSVAGLILIAPVISGRRYVRELRTMRLAASIGTETTARANSEVAAPAMGALEVSGFLLSAASVGALADIDLNTQSLPRNAEVLVIDGASMPLARAWSEGLCRGGIAASYKSLPGLVEMLMTAPHFASIPTEMISAMSDWLIQRSGHADTRINDVEHRESAQRISVHKAMTLSSPGFAHGAPVTERPLFFAPDSLLFGIVTEPDERDTPDRAVILINAGADYHIGASGIYVTLARRWARSGFLVLRMDLAGLGESNSRPGRPDNEVFPPRALDDIRAAVDWVRTRYGVRHITLGGLCSGAFHTLQAAIGAVPIDRAMMVNPENYFWDEGRSIYDRQTVELVRQRDTPSSNLLSPEFWKRLVRGQIDVGYVLGTYIGRFSLSAESSVRNIARRLHIPLPNDLGRQLEAAAARGVQLIFVFARGEPGLDLLGLQGGVSLERLGDRCRIHIVDNADHVFSKLESRQSLEKILSAELIAPPQRG